MDEGDEYPSDTSDEDYVPSDGHIVSEEDGSGEDEELLDGEKDGTNKGLKTKGKRKRRTKRKGELDPRKRKRGLGNDDTSESDETSDNMPEVQQDRKPDVNEKKKADDLWADFMKDVGQTKPKCVASSGLGALSNITDPSVIKATTTTVTDVKSTEKTNTQPCESKKSEKVTITQEYDFAGETVKITKEVDSNSKEAKEVLKKEEESEESKASPGPSVPVGKKPAGLGNILGKIGKKQKISTLEKSKLDWNNFKRKEGIEDELQIHNRGKEGYIERMSFLERTDYRQFEIERSLRMSSSKR